MDRATGRWLGRAAMAARGGWPARVAVGALAMVGAVGALAACAAPAPPASHVLAPPMLEASTDTAAGASDAEELLLPGPAPRPRLEEIAGIGLPSDERCARCHQEIAAEWRGSLHHRAWNNAYFVRAYAIEPTPFCRKCHAPSADPATEPSPEARAAGVGCTTCHVVPAGIVGTRAMAIAGAEEQGGAADEGHAVLGDARLATAAACGGCHDFALPGPPGYEAGPMQDTLGEHARSAAADRTCQDCHMPRAAGADGRDHRSHAFRVQGDRAMLAQAVEVGEAAFVDGEVRLALAPGRIGHAFPTGDLHRQVEVRVTAIDDGGASEHESDTTRVILRRTFGPRRVRRDLFVNAERSDTRLAAPRTIALPVPAGTKRARWQIVWQRLPAELATHLGLDLREHELVVLEGTVP